MKFPFINVPFLPRAFLCCPVTATTRVFKRGMSVKQLSSLTKEEKRSFLGSFDAVLSDCDGVLWLGNTPIPGATDVIRKFKEVGKKVFFITNNGTQTRAGFAKKCSSLGFNVSENEIISTAWLVGQYLKMKGFKKKVFIIGSTAIKDELENVGIESFGCGPDNFDPEVHTKLWTEKKGPEMLSSDVGAVVVSYDFYFSLPKILKACSYLANREVLFIATNTDEKFPLPGGIFAPGAGAFVAAVTTCAQREPTVMGKPNTMVISNVLDAERINLQRCLMIGDRCNTDIYFGNQGNMSTLLVETGVHKFNDLKEFESHNKFHLLPTYYTSTIADILSLF